MHTEKHIRLFRNGRNQALRIPKEFELEGNEATIRQDKGRLIIEPIRKGRLIHLLSSMEPIEEAFPDIDKDFITLDEVEI
jgi:antitoxin VapB